MKQSMTFSINWLYGVASDYVTNTGYNVMKIWEKDEKKKKQLLQEVENVKKQHNNANKIGVRAYIWDSQTTYLYILQTIYRNRYENSI